MDQEITGSGTEESKDPDQESEEVQKPEEPEKEPLIRRINRALGPLAGGLILDLVDLSTWGPLGIFGFFIGLLVGWWIGSIYGFSNKIKLVWALLAGFYCLVPLTEFIPVATIISACARLRESPDYRNKDASEKEE